MRTKNKLNPHTATGCNLNRVKLVGGECYHYFAIPYILGNVWSNLQKMAKKRINLFDFALLAKEGWIFISKELVNAES